MNILKKTLIILLISCTTLAGKSQADTVLHPHKKWTISTNVIGQPYIFNISDGIPNAFTGIGLKRYFGNIGIRVGYEFFDNNQTEDFILDSGVNTYEQKFVEEHAIRIGVEYKKNYSKLLALRIFADYALIPFTSQNTIYTTRATPILFAQIEGVSQGGILGLGIDWTINEHFSVGMESRLDVLFINQKQHIQNFVKNTEVEYNLKDENMQLKLIGNLSLNYHF